MKYTFVMYICCFSVVIDILEDVKNVLIGGNSHLNPHALKHLTSSRRVLRILICLVLGFIRMLSTPFFTWSGHEFFLS